MRRRRRTDPLPRPPDDIADGARVEVWARDEWLALLAADPPLEAVGDAMWTVGLVAYRNYTDARRQWARLAGLTTEEARQVCPTGVPRWPLAEHSLGAAMRPSPQY